MQKAVEWLYDEYKYCGVDFSDNAVVDRYDKQHGSFRDFKAESEAVISLLGLGPEDTVIDLGCGTGGIIIHIAEHVKKIHAVDISQAMLARCADKCSAAGITNVEFHRGGFLSYQHEGEHADAVISQVALHHLPDMWKQVALIRCFDMLKPGGRFLLVDVVFSFAPRDYSAAIEKWLDRQKHHTGQGAVTHIRQEYSTFDWIIKELLQRAGFVIESVRERDSFIQAYVCSKPAC